MNYISTHIATIDAFCAKVNDIANQDVDKILDEFESLLCTTCDIYVTAVKRDNMSKEDRKIMLKYAKNVLEIKRRALKQYVNTDQ
jgi:L-arabinose isomerase